MKEQKQKSATPTMDLKDFAKTVGLAFGALGLALVPVAGEVEAATNNLPESEKVVVSTPTKQDVKKEVTKKVIQQPTVNPAPSVKSIPQTGKMTGPPRP